MSPSTLYHEHSLSTHTTVQYHRTKLLPKESQLKGLEDDITIHILIKDISVKIYSLLPQVFRNYRVHDTAQKYGLCAIIIKTQIILTLVRHMDIHYVVIE